MKKRLSATRLRADLYRVLDEVLESGRPVEIERRGRILRIEAADPVDPMTRLEPHPDYIVGDPEALVEIDWTEEWKPHL